MNTIPLFLKNNQNSHILLDLFQKGESKAYHKGEDLDPFQRKNQSVINLIIYGYVKVSSYDKEGTESVQLLYGKGDVFPLLNLLDPANPQNASFEALTKVRLLSLPVDTFSANIKSNIIVSNAIAERLLAQFTLVVDRIENMGYQTAEKKVVYCLLTLGARFGLKKGNTIYLENIFTHNLVSNMLGMTRETVSREYEKLRKNGFIETPQNELILKDVKALTDVVDAPLSLCILLHTENTK